MDSKRRLTVILERDEGGFYVASVPELRGCHTQGSTLDEVMGNVRDAARLCLEAKHGEDVKMEFLGVHTIEV
ncbi:MAG: type II toxin-antitoxin system HicB family antitoxin [Chloroflexi bacterium]|nr:type II toxin-antitoxin system HicB family antitoxin [Chloroflexota bacterium]